MKTICGLKFNLKFDYQVNQKGIIFSPISGRYIKYFLDKDGYPKVKLIDETGQRKAIPLHRIVLCTYNPVPNMDNLQVNHIDGDKTNFHLSNLEWVTCQENIQHAIRTNLRDYKGEKNTFAKLSEQDVIKIIDLILKNELTYKQIGCQFNVHEETIARIKRKKSWTHLTNNIDFEKRSTTRRKP